ncbi:MAG TPA: RNA degradosome polyphosphate kinase [Firmicutes bacterium]|nr:RNA degradosome polyphosphate kinase [Bacillota bacterium]
MKKKSTAPRKEAVPYFINRELSWLDFNARVLEEAYEKDNPVLERCKFLGITASNLDEFFMVRVAGVREQVRSGYREPDAAGLTPQQQLEKLSEKIHAFTEKQYNCLQRSLIPLLRQHRVLLLRGEDLSRAQREFVDDYFEDVLFPVLTPLAVDRSRPFPMLLNKSLNLAVRLEREGEDGTDRKDREGREERETAFAVVQVPSILPRLVELPGEGARAFLPLEEILILHLEDLFELHRIQAVAAFRVTRNSDLAIDEEAEDLLIEIQESIKKRKRGRPVRLELSRHCDPELREFLVDMLRVEEPDIYEIPGPLDLTFCFRLSSLDDSLRLPPIEPVPAADFVGWDDVFAAIRERDRFVHHPYESFDAVVNFVRTAAEDPDVLAIKQTLYRVSGNSPIIAALIRAAENGKQVTVLVELKARFDEENNIHWALKLEEAGCHVVYGLAGLKTHCKILLVVRREEDGLRRYVHLGTGNYNDSTARQYTDMGMFTCRESYGADASSLFNVLTGYSRPPRYNRLVAAPDGLRSFFYERIDREIENVRQNLPAGIFAKVNSLADPAMVVKLYEASQAGVPVTLVVRGICCLTPGVPGVSENITVMSLVGQLLEHSRIFRFENGGSPKLYLGSADWMPRNLDRRVELVFPVEEEAIRERVEEVIRLNGEDTVNARVEDSEGRYGFKDMRRNDELNSQLELARRARAAFRAAQEAAEQRE